MKTFKNIAWAVVAIWGIALLISAFLSDPDTSNKTAARSSSASETPTADAPLPAKQKQRETSYGATGYIEIDDKRYTVLDIEAMLPSDLLNKEAVIQGYLSMVFDVSNIPDGFNLRTKIGLTRDTAIDGINVVASYPGGDVETARELRRTLYAPIKAAESRAALVSLTGKFLIYSDTARLYFRADGIETIATQR